MVAGPDDAVKAFCLLPGEDPATFKKEVVSWLGAIGDDPVLFMADLFGGTPSNVLASLLMRENTEVVSGVNLPALIEVLARKEGESLSSLRDIALDAVRSSAVDVREKLAERLRQRKAGE